MLDEELHVGVGEVGGDFFVGEVLACLGYEALGAELGGFCGCVIDSHDVGEGLYVEVDLDVEVFAVGVSDACIVSVVEHGLGEALRYLIRVEFDQRRAWGSPSDGWRSPGVWRVVRGVCLGGCFGCGPGLLE